MQKKFNFKLFLCFISSILAVTQSIYGADLAHKSYKKSTFQLKLPASSKNQSEQTTIARPSANLEADIEEAEENSSVVAPDFHRSDGRLTGSLQNACRKWKRSICPVLLTGILIAGIIIYDQTHKNQGDMETDSYLDDYFDPDNPFDPDHPNSTFSEGVGTCTRKRNNREILKVSQQIFDSKLGLNVHIFMNPVNWTSLKSETSKGPGHDDPENSYDWYPAYYNINGIDIRDGKVKKKSWLGSFSTTKPGLKLKNKDYDIEDEDDYDSNPLAKFSKFTLNNCKQDISFVRQCVAYDVFRRLGAFGPLCQLAHVCVNNEPMGIYVSIEPLTKIFFDRVIGHHNITLYEGDISAAKGRGAPWIGSDFDHGMDTFELKEGSRDWESSNRFIELTQILQSTSGQPLTPYEEQILIDMFDMDMVYRFFIGEYILSHWDGYVRNLNNYYIFYDHTLEKIFFLPWGTDQVLKNNRFQFNNIRGSLFNILKRSQRFSQEISDLYEKLRLELLQDSEKMDQFIDLNQGILESILSETEIHSLEPLIATVKNNLRFRISMNGVII